MTHSEESDIRILGRLGGKQAMEAVSSSRLDAMSRYSLLASLLSMLNEQIG